MRIPADENVSRRLVLNLRERGHDVAWVREDSPGIPDAEVLARAEAEGRLVVTFDKGFGELAFRSGLSARCGVLLFRTAVGSPEELATQAAAIIGSRDDWNGHLTVVAEGRIRLRLLPRPTPPRAERSRRRGGRPPRRKGRSGRRNR